MSATLNPENVYKRRKGTHVQVLQVLMVLRCQVVAHSRHQNLPLVVSYHHRLPPVKHDFEGENMSWDVIKKGNLFHSVRFAVHVRRSSESKKVPTISSSEPGGRLKSIVHL